MERFSDNFRGGKTDTICPLCLSHEDTQYESFNCKFILNEIKIEGQFDKIFEDIEYHPKLTTTITKIIQIRKRVLKQD